MEKVFMDTAAWIALLDKSDQLSTQALGIMTELACNKSQLFTTEFVLLEVANRLSSVSMRQNSVKFIERIASAKYQTVIPTSRNAYLRGLDLYRRRPDKEWGLTDCISMTVMQDEGITIAFTSDQHFRQAGFQTLLTV